MPVAQWSTPRAPSARCLRSEWCFEDHNVLIARPAPTRAAPVNIGCRDAVV